MIRFLKGAVCALLLAAVTGTWLGIRVYEEQQNLLAHLQTHQTGDVQIAETLNLELDDWQSDLVQPHLASRALKQLELRAGQVVEQLATTQDELAAQKTANAAVSKEKALIEAELAAVQRDLEAQIDALALATAAKQGLEKELAGTITALEEKTSLHNALEEQLFDADGSLTSMTEDRDYWKAAWKEEVGLYDPLNPEAAREATVLDSRPDFGFIVLDKGSRDKLLPGATALIHRNEELLGRARLTRTEKGISIATIDPDWRLGDIRAGDKVLIEHAFLR